MDIVIRLYDVESQTQLQEILKGISARELTGEYLEGKFNPIHQKDKEGYPLGQFRIIKD